MLEKFRILIVDDDRMVLDLMVQVAKRHDVLEPERLSDPEEAIRRIKQNPPYHIILTDLSMPGFTGLDVLRAARTRSPDTRGIIVTGFGDRESTREAIKLGVSDYLHKPFRLEELDLALRKAIEHFKLRKQQMDLQQEADDLRTMIEEKTQIISVMRGESQRLSSELEPLRQKVGEEQDSAEALQRAVAAGNPAASTHNMLDKGSVVKPKELSPEETEEIRKRILAKTYKSIVR